MKSKAKCGWCKHRKHSTDCPRCGCDPKHGLRGPQRKEHRGFAVMKVQDPARLRGISREAGTRSQGLGVGHRWNKWSARANAGKGGRARWKAKKGL